MAQDFDTDTGQVQHPLSIYICIQMIFALLQCAKIYAANLPSLVEIKQV